MEANGGWTTTGSQANGGEGTGDDQGEDDLKVDWQDGNDGFATNPNQNFKKGRSSTSG